MTLDLPRDPFLDGQESVGELIALLGHSSLRLRRSAVAALAGRDPAETLPGILEALSHPHDAAVRSAAADVLLRYGRRVLPGLVRALDPVRHRDRTIQLLVVLGRIPSRETLEAVMPLASHPDPSVAAAAIGCLGSLRDPSCVPTLLGVLDAGQRWQCFYAIDALGEVGHAAAVARLVPLVEDPYYRKAVLRALGKIGDEAVIPPLVGALRHGTPCPDRTALAALGDMVDRARTGASRELLEGRIGSVLRGKDNDSLRDGLVDLLQRSDGDRQRLAARALGWCADPAAIPALVEALAEPFVAEQAACALRALSAGQASRLLEAAGAVALPPDALRRVVEIAGCQRGPEVDGFLRAALENEEDEVRQAAAEALAAQPLEEDLEALVRALGDSSTLVAEAAVEGLLILAARGERVRDHVAGRVEGLTAAATPEMRQAALKVIAGLGSEAAAETLDLALHDPAASVRRAAVALLGDGADPERLWRLTVALADEDARVREEAVRAVGRLRDGRARGVLLAALQDRSIWVRCQAARALSEHPAVEVLAALEDAARREVPPVRVSAIAALGCMDGRARELLTQLGSDPDPEVRRAALRALGSMEDGAPLGLLARGLEDGDWSVRCAAAEGLGAARPAGAFNPLARAMDRERDPVVRRALLEALFQVESESALSFLVGALAEKDVAETAASLLVQGHRVFADDLRAEWASAEDPAVREGLAVVLREIGRREAAAPAGAEEGDEPDEGRL